MISKKRICTHVFVQKILSDYLKAAVAKALKILGERFGMYSLGSHTSRAKSVIASVPKMMGSHSL